MKNNTYISQAEIETIEKVVLDKDIIDERKHNNENLFAQIQIRKALSKVKKNLKKDETIDSYISGRNYSIDSVRLNLAGSIMFSICSHPIYKWNSNCLLIKTSSRFILVELTFGFDYSKLYDISSEIHVVKKDDYFYLVVSGDNKQTVIQFNYELFDMTMNILKNCADVIYDKDFKLKSFRFGKIVPIIFLIYIIIVTVIFIFHPLQ